jgi:hypothetical protein
MSTEAYFVRSGFQGLLHCAASSRKSDWRLSAKLRDTCKRPSSEREYSASGSYENPDTARVSIHAGHARSIGANPCSDSGERPILRTPRKRTEAHHQAMAFRLCPELAASGAPRVSKETPAHVARSIFFISLRRSLIVDVLVRGIACSARAVAFGWAV